MKNLLLLGLFTWLGGRILDLDQTSDTILQAGVLPEKKKNYIRAFGCIFFLLQIILTLHS